MKVTVISKLNKRLWPSTKNTPLPNPLLPNDILEVVEEVSGEAVTPTNNIWFKTDKDFYVWSGGVRTTTLQGTTSFALNSFKETDHWWISNFHIGKLWHDGFSGKGIKIGVLDSGLSLPHPDLILESENQQDLTGSPSGIKDHTGHGTHIAGILKATANGFGIKGIAFNSDFYFGKITNDLHGDRVEYLIKGIEWAIEKKIDIISISHGVVNHSDLLEQQVNHAADNNILIVCAAGNKNETIGNSILYPARYDQTLSIGGVTNKNLPLSDTINALQTDLFAPGENILSTHLNNTYQKLSGSSQSVPFVAGVASLLLEAKRKTKPLYKGLHLKKELLQSADGKEYGKLINPLNSFKI